MDCKEFSNLLDAYMDGALSDAEAARMQAHAEECADCASLMTVRLDCRRADEEIQVPDAFSSSWRRMIEEEADMENNTSTEKKTKKFPGNWKAWAAVAAALVFVLGGTLLNRDSYPRMSTRSQSAAESKNSAYASNSGTLSMARSADAGAGKYAYSDMAAVPEAAEYEMDYDMAAEEPMVSGEETRQEKIIRTASFTIKTTAYDQDVQQLKDLTALVQGRIEHFSSSGDQKSGQTRSASMTLRIPSQRLDEFLSGAQEIGNITAMTQEMQDVSDSYYDVQTRLNTQKEKMSRLQTMMQNATDMSDLIELESAIADTQYQIDRYTGQLRSYDSKVDYSTVYITIRETRATEIVTLSLGERILSGLENSLENGREFLEDLVIFLVSSLPWLIMIGLAVLAVRLIVKKMKKNRNKKGAASK
ncbi:MAG: DUF4349 domain-containing protein [Clostridia bacterium]|nr:DUF4349 domain-containing protein [Clostridia bacterium]